MNAPNELSFLPDDYLDRKAQRRTNAICAFLFLVVMIAIGSAFTLTERSTRTVDRRYDTKMREFTSEANRIKQAEEMQDKQRQMARQAELAASLLEKVPRSFVLADVTNSMPAGVSLLDLTLDSKRRTPAPSAEAQKNAFEAKKAAAANKGKKDPLKNIPEPKVFDVYMKISGVAYTDVQVAQFIGKLGQSKLLRDVNLLISDQFEKEGEQLRKFQIEALLDPTAEVLPGEKAKTQQAAAAVETK